jgi:hypothetical protein
MRWSNRYCADAGVIHGKTANTTTKVILDINVSPLVIE